MLWIFAVALLVRMALNTLDGMMARKHVMKSVPGEVLNELGDVLSDAVMYLPLVKLTGVNPRWVLSFIFLSLFNEFIGVMMKAATGLRRYDGPMGKSDRAPGYRAHLPALLLLARGNGGLRLHFRGDERIAGCQFDDPHKNRIGR